MEEQEKQLRKNIAEKIRMLRARDHISQECLADKTNLTQAYIYKLENELANPSIYVMQKIANAFGVTVNDIIY